ncbi:FUSC family protein [Streptomyces sp. YIM 98790]|uniref:FUSC family protein n=1 Tax=Streptomyces sp. YIM 98790 TaxID=2689077 RepID=UPI001409E482|nr:FUSC family protein [Streptomyces sp. YIM 98790]
MFVAPDPGLFRLRNSTRAVLGIGLAVTTTALAGFPLTACLTGGLAALLALFTVTDTTVRAQAVTTALLPAVGLPVLALATALHAQPLARDAAFLAVAFAGVWARRWGVRGNTLGIFAFMTYFVVQFLRTGTEQFPVLAAAVTLSLAVAALTRFVLWPLDRSSPPPALPGERDAPGLRRVSLRLACQTTAACAFALGVGQAVSAERWYWAVGAAWWIFVNTASRGETLVRGFRRVAGTVLGIGAGMLVALPLDGALPATVPAAAVCVFLIFYTAPVSYSWMMFAVTVLVGLLYGLMGLLHPGLFALRLTETAVGALGAGLAVALVLPVTTHAATVDWIHRTLECVRECAVQAGRRAAGDPAADPARPAAELAPLLARARMALAPLLHPLNPLRARQARARRIMALLDECAVRVRALADELAAPGSEAGTEAGTARNVGVVAACARVETAVMALLASAEPPPPAAEPDPHPALVQLHGLEAALARLAAPLHASPDAPVTAA